MGEEVVVVPQRYRLFHLHHLALELGLADGEGEGGPAVPHSLPQPRLETFLGGVEIMMDNLPGQSLAGLW